ncbi:hypothetical protein [Pseudomonas baetica]|uniref:hypothetical protein n=1 Tax=Pseudomonas baetica TaxID=674054 RepID=UPI002405338A|nr:hypothetical protein [Pseudomonas baetica]MDF9779031.1 hypothetical protein [Pseudomonas baetica]
MQTATRQPYSLPRITVLYETREEIIQELSAQRSISLSDAADLDRGGLCRLADDHWSACSEDLRQAMLNHPHHFVRSCAVVAQSNLTKAHDGVLKEQSQDLLRQRLRDLDRQAAEMECNPEFQARVGVPNSQEHEEMVALNVTLFHVRHRLKHHFGFVDTKHAGNWLL